MSGVFQFERQLRDWNIRGVWDLKDVATHSRIPQVFHASDDPNRRVPIVWEPEDYMIAIAGDVPAVENPAVQFTTAA